MASEVTDLLRKYACTLEKLKDKGVVQTRNSPVGDYAEWLVAKAFTYKIYPPSTSGYDLCDCDLCVPGEKCVPGFPCVPCVPGEKRVPCVPPCLPCVSQCGKRYQVKARWLRDVNSNRQLSIIRKHKDGKLAFDFLIAVYFDNTFNVTDAYKIPHTIVKKHAKLNRYQNGHILNATVMKKVIGDDAVECITKSLQDEQ